MKLTYNVHSVEVCHQPDGTPIGYVTLTCTVEEARAAGALLYCDVTLEPVEEEASSVASALPGTATYDLDDTKDYARILCRLPVRAHAALANVERWHIAFGHGPPLTLRSLLANTRRDLLCLCRVGPGTVREIREALVEAGLPDLEE